MARLPNWQGQFHQYILQAMRASQRGELVFDWNPNTPNANNCVTFVSGGLKAITGRDFYAEVTGAQQLEDYSDPKEAFRVLRELGFTSVDQLLGSIFPSVPVMMASRGDVLIIPGQFSAPQSGELDGLRVACALADPPFFWAVTTEGLGKGSIRHAIKAYKVN